MPLLFKELKEFTVQQLATLKKEYEPMRGKTISIPNANKMNSMLDRMTKDMLKKLANADIPFISTGAASKLVTKHGMKFTDFKLNMSEADELQQEACWTGYKQVGFKKKGDRRVPNCVPESVVREMFGDMINEINDLRGSFSDAQLERMKQEWKNKPASAMTQGVKQMIMNLDAPTRAALENAKINHISKFAGSTFEQKESVDPSCKICEGEACQCAQGEDIQEGMVKRVMQTIHDKLSKEGGAAGFDDLAKEVKKEFGITLSKDTLKNMPGVKQHRDGDYILEADLSKSQVKMVHKKADKMPKQDFIKRYGKDGDSVRYATATNMVKKQLGIEEEEFVPEQNKGENMNEATYKDKFNAAMKDFGINSLDDLKSDADKKKFFKHVDGMHKAKNEELTPAQKKLPVGLQKAIAKKQGDKEEMKEYGSMNAEMMKKEMMKKMEMLKAETDPEKMEMMRKEMMKEMDKMPEMMKKEMMKKMEMMKQDEMMKKEMMKKMEMLKAETDPEKMEMMKSEMMKKMNAMKMPEMMKKEMMKKMEMAMKEGFASDAQRRAAFASGYKEKGKKKKEEVSEMMSPQEMMKMNAMKMPIRAMYMKSKKEMKTGDDDMKPMASMKMNAVTDPKKMNAMTMQDPKQDMAAGYMKSDVRAAVKDGGGDDMSKVKDKPVMQEPMKKINAMYKREKYMPVKEGSIQDTIAKMQMGEHQLVEVQEENLEKMIADYLKKGGTISKLPPALAKGMKPSEMKPHKVGAKGVIKSMKMGEVREFVTTYNSHFLTNYKAEELLER